jgi:hypothetical protein
MLAWPPKAPGEVLDYDIDWSLRLNGDTILTSNYAIITTDGVAGSLAIQSNSFLLTRTKVWVNSGTLGFTYVLQNTVTTANGDTMIESSSLPIRTK